MRQRSVTQCFGSFVVQIKFRWSEKWFQRRSAVNTSRCVMTLIYTSGCSAAGRASASHHSTWGGSGSGGAAERAVYRSMSTSSCPHVEVYSGKRHWTSNNERVSWGNASTRTVDYFTASLFPQWWKMLNRFFLNIQNISYIFKHVIITAVVLVLSSLSLCIKMSF